MKLLLLAVLAFLLISSAYASQMMLRGFGVGSASSGCTNCMTTPLIFTGSSASFPSNAANSFSRVFGGPGGGGNSTTLANEQLPMPVVGNITNLAVSFPTTLSQGSYAISLNKGGSSQSLTCTIDTTHATCTDTTHSVSVTTGDLVTWQITPTGTPTAQTAQPTISATFVSTVGQESPLFGGATAATAATAATNWGSIGGAFATYTATEANISAVVPTAGTIDQLYMFANGLAGASATWTVTVYHQGSATSLSCATATNGQSCNDTNGAHAFTVAQGDTISVETCPSNTATCPAGSAPTARIIGVAMRWVPTTSNEALFLDSWNTVPTTNANRFGPLSGAANNLTTETDLGIVPIGMTIKKLTVAQNAAPGGVTTRAVNLREGNGTQGNVGSPGNVSCTVASASTTCNDNTDSFAATAGTLVNIQTVPTGTNAALTWFKVGAVVTVP